MTNKKPELTRYKVKNGKLVAAKDGYLFHIKDAAELEEATQNLQASYYADLGILSSALQRVFGEDKCMADFKDKGLGPAEAAAKIVLEYGVLTGRIEDPQVVAAMEAEDYA